MLNDQVNQVLKLTRNESSVLKILNNTSEASISELVRSTKIPRMSLYPALFSLKERGLAEYYRKGSRKFWKMVDNEELAKLFAHMAEQVSSSGTTSVITGQSGFNVIRGMNNLYKIWEQAFEENKNNRVYAIQPTKSLKNILAKLNWEEKIKPINESISKRGVIIEGLIREDYLAEYLTHFKNDKEKQKQVLETIINRPTDMVYVENKYLNSATDLMMFGDRAFLINWKDEIALEIRNKDMLSILMELYDLARGYGRKVNQAEYVRELIKKIDQST